MDLIIECQRRVTDCLCKAHTGYVMVCSRHTKPIVVSESAASGLLGLEYLVEGNNEVLF